MTKMLDLIHMMQRGEIAPPPVAALIGFTLASVEPGCAVVEFEATPRHANPMGTLHGGVLCDIADAAMGMAWASTLERPAQAGRSHACLARHLPLLRPRGPRYNIPP